MRNDLSSFSKACLIDNTANAKHFLLNLYNAVPTSKTLGRLCSNGIKMFCVCWKVFRLHIFFV